jgi:hypothetical protein
MEFSTGVSARPTDQKLSLPYNILSLAKDQGFGLRMFGQLKFSLRETEFRRLHSVSQNVGDVNPKQTSTKGNLWKL